jgi:hypothetical protein
MMITGSISVIAIVISVVGIFYGSPSPSTAHDQRIGDVITRMDALSARMNQLQPVSKP